MPSPKGRGEEGRRREVWWSQEAGQDRGGRVPRESGRGAGGSAPGPAPTAAPDSTSVKPPRCPNCVTPRASVQRLLDSRFMCQNNLGPGSLVASLLAPHSRPAPLGPRPLGAPLFAACAPALAPVCLCSAGEKIFQRQVGLDSGRPSSVCQEFEMQTLWRESPRKKDAGLRGWGGAAVAALFLWFSGPRPGGRGRRG
ncbi:hypothetical protein HJG60_009406 [Phyllostomus discolor]|uniref:Uncharacterized protein n=1 Tax=Phyllostomus discolor TaxID=89673 RepID=A0A833YL98_9CHIR|nr:hypothetical protein HJG60_009406 [Phyllostomus discolor]